MLYKTQFQKFFTAGVLILTVLTMIGGVTQSNIEAKAGYTTTSLVPLTNVVQVSPGRTFTCALTKQGGVKCWGKNNSGQLGDGTTETRLSAVDVVGFPSGVQAVEVGQVHTCVLTTQGGVKCWGYNGYGELGDGTTESKATPVDVIGLSSGVKSLVVGDDHSCALTTQGGVKCWGFGFNGQLGYGGTAETNSTPVDVIGLQSGVQTIAAGVSHTCAITEQGGVKCWGFNFFGQLGSGKTSFQELRPVDVVGLGSSAKAIAIGASHSCSLMSLNGMKCWGANSQGQLGNGTYNDLLVPTDVVGLQSNLHAITAGQYHTCALVTQGLTKCWGFNGFGQLGLGTTISQSLPVDVSGLSSGVKYIAAGTSHTCAVTDQDEVKCWGLNQYGQLGDGTKTDRTMPVTVLVEEIVPTVTPTNTPTHTLTSTPTLTPTPTSTPVNNQQLFTISQNSWKFANKPYPVSWQNYADAFGESNVQDANGKRLEFAEKYYNNVVKSVGDNGLCLGFATTAGMLFSENSHVSSIPGYTKISDVPAPPTSGKYFQQGAIPDYLAKYHTYQLGEQYLSAGMTAIGRSINETVGIIRNSVDQELQDPVILTFYYVKYGNSSTCYAHTVLPFAYRTQGDSTLIEIYDSTFPGIPKTLSVNTDGSWRYQDWSNANTCKYNDGKTYNSVIGAVRLSEFDTTPRLKDSQARASIDNITILSSPNATMTVANFNMVPLLSSAQISDSVQAVSGTQYLLKDTETVSLTVKYALTSTTEIGLFNQGEYLGMVVGETTAGQQDVLVFDTAKAKVQLRAGATLSRTVEMINQLPNGEYVQKFTCSIPDSSRVSVASSANQLQISSGSSLENCTLGVLLPTNENLSFQLPSILAQDTVTGIILSEQGHILNLAIDHGSNGVVDDNRTVNPDETGDVNLYLPVIKR